VAWGLKRGLQLTNYGDLVRIWVTTTLAPQTIFVPILLYYDHRVRKEAYDIGMQAEDSKR
jgi:hypothetical protein